ncbi:ABC transporter substrate-binding protein [Pseudonocardia kunmingensis]|uniref:Peptide/nickel transport system substrate-binding protein n=1 Tax=Pseudonocardia kunmingensis TaxID=630975 RepID=A0A543DPZ6_9PSEU|nr:ABC transporter substrate-binding protein [Pseudonocardia kunmingensis]TQM11378.1 peptide/nickel transport system substrate-binding protein [Pseudonocardia kunmingensis]
MASRCRQGVAVVVGLVVAGVLTACGSSDGGTGAVGQVDRSATLRAALDTPPPSMDPHTTASAIAQHPYSSLVYDRLTQMGPDLEVRPMLAMSWELAADRRSMTFSLRDGVSFSDGTALDADAVKASLDRALTSPESTVTSALAVIGSVEVVDPRTVRITATESAAALPAVLAGTEASIVSPAALRNPDLDVRPVGSGPYQLEELQLGQTATFVRREGYWDPEAQKAARIEMSFMPDPNARLSSLSSGQIDIANAAEGMYEQVTRMDGVVVHAYPAAATINVRLNTNRPNIDKAEVRQALNYAIDREALVQSLLQGRCDAIGQPLPEIYPGHLTDPPVAYTHDPERARQLLAQAGVPGGFTMTMLVGSGNRPFDQLATAMQAQLVEVGITVEIVTQTAPTIFETWGKGGFDAYTIVSPTSASPVITLRNTFQAASRYPGPRPPAFDEALAAAASPASDDTTVTASLERASSVAVEEAMNVWICGRRTHVAAQDDVVGADTMGISHFAGILDLRGVGRTG